MTDLRNINARYRMFSCIADDGVPSFSVSDDISVKGMQATAGSRMLEGYRPVYDATVVTRMRGSGATLIGTTHMDEFGSNAFCVTGTGVPANPFDLERVCGGSSGGAACAASVLGGHTALGTSAGGSVSSPAAFCGVFGLTPTFGRVSRHGQIDGLSSSMGPIGILSSKTGPIKKYLPVISGNDGHDPVSSAQPELTLGGRRLKSVAVPDGVADDASADVRKAFEASLDRLRSMSVDVEHVKFDALKHSMPAHYALSVTEMATNLVQYCGLRCGRQDGDLSLPFDDYFISFRSRYFGEEAKIKTILGTYMTMGENRRTYYLKALGVRRMLIDGYKDILRTHDAVLTPTMPSVAPKLSDAVGMGSLGTYTESRFTVPPVFAGMPSLSVPCGYSDGLPIGMQFVSDHWQEDVLVSAAEMWEDAFDVRGPEVRS